MNGLYFLIPVLLLIGLYVSGYHAEAYTVHKGWVFDYYGNNTSDASGWGIHALQGDATDCLKTGTFDVEFSRNNTVVNDQWFLMNQTADTNGCEFYGRTFWVASLPDGLNVTKVEYVFDAEVGANGFLGCDIDLMNTRNVPPALSAWSYYNTVSSHSSTTQLVDNGSECILTAGNYNEITIDLGVSAASTVNLQSTDGFLLFFSWNDLDRDGTWRYMNVTNDFLRVYGEQLPDPPKVPIATIDNWIGLVLGWNPGDTYVDPHDTYTIERWSGSSWVQMYAQTPANTTDTTPTQASTGKYRIADYGQQELANCKVQFLSNSLADYLEFWLHGCYTTTDSSINNYDVDTMNGTETYKLLDGEVWLDTGIYDVTGDSATNQYIVNATSIPEVLTNATEPFSMSIWMQTKNYTNNGKVQNVFTIGNAEDLIIHKLRIMQTGEVSFLLRGVTSSYNLLTSGINVTDNQPHFLTGTYGGCGDQSCQQLYVDGELVVQGGSNPITDDVLPYNAIIVGGHSFAIDNAFEGYVKDPMIFSKELSAYEIGLLYNEQVDTRFPTSAPTDLSATVIDLDTVQLDFTIPTPKGIFQPVCYQVNYTTPQGDPTSVITNCILSTNGLINVDDLNTFDNNYSFRIASNNLAVINGSSPIANTTSFDAFVIGSINTPVGDNPNILPITFVEYQDNSTQTTLQVIYDSSYDLNCNFGYVFGMTNNTYTGLTENTISGSQVYHNFTLTNPENEIINVYCWDSLDNSTDGRYLIDQSSIPFFNQISDFRTGVFGPSGMFGIFDFATLIIVVVSMIGFNRYNPALGVVTMIAFLGVMTYYQVIAWQSSLIGVSALVLMLAIMQVRKP